MVEFKGSGVYLTTGQTLDLAQLHSLVEDLVVARRRHRALAHHRLRHARAPGGVDRRVVAYV